LKRGRGGKKIRKGGEKGKKISIILLRSCWEGRDPLKQKKCSEETSKKGEKKGAGKRVGKVLKGGADFPKESLLQEDLGWDWGVKKERTKKGGKNEKNKQDKGCRRIS